MSTWRLNPQSRHWGPGAGCGGGGREKGHPVRWGAGLQEMLRISKWNSGFGAGRPEPSESLPSTHRVRALYNVQNALPSPRCTLPAGIWGIGSRAQLYFLAETQERVAQRSDTTSWSLPCIFARRGGSPVTRQSLGPGPGSLAAEFSAGTLQREPVSP